MTSNELNINEYEYKFRADNIKLTEFESLMETLPFIKKQVCSSFDYYFLKEGSIDEFQRYRESDKPELTKKVKTKTANNWSRIESDLALDPNRVNFKQVQYHVGLDNYKFNFKIFKSCSVYWFDNTNIVFYTVFDENMNKLSSFIECEVTKECVNSLGDKAFDVLKECESKLEPLGISPQNRLKKSLFELYRKI